MKCPHCTVEFHDNPSNVNIGADVEGGWIITKRTCPACNKLVLSLLSGKPVFTSNRSLSHIETITSVTVVRPRASSRPPCPPQVPQEFKGDYLEACLVLPDSAKAAAALGRRCLQNMLRDVAGVKPGSLADEIQQVLDSGKLPSDLAESIDAIRNIGNFAAHPLKGQQSGLILDVESGEAEWTLDVLELLFDFYFVRPAQLKKKRDALNQKLQAAGKPPMK